MLIKGSILLVIFITSYSIYHFKRNKDSHSEKFGLASSLLVGVSSMIFGFLLMKASGYNVLISTVASILFAGVGGVFVGDSRHRIKVINHVLSGLIGAIIGSLLSYMTFSSNTVFLIVDVLFILSIYFILRLFDKLVTVQTKKNKKLKKVSSIPTFALVSILFLLLIIISYNSSSINLGSIGQPQTKQAEMDVENDLQVATIHVTPSGFDPKNTILEANTMVKIIFKAEIKEGNESFLVSNDLKLNVKLMNGDNMILLDNPLPGKYEFMIDSGKLKGTLTVK